MLSGAVAESTIERKHSIRVSINKPGSFYSQPYSPWSSDTYFTAEYEPPAFRAEWGLEFATYYYRPRPLLIATCIMAVSGCGLMALHMLDEDGGRGGIWWAVLNWAGEGVCGVMSACIAMLLCIPSCRPFCIKHYGAVAAFWTTTIIVSWNSVLAFDELRRSQFQMPHELGGGDNITYSRNVKELAGLKMAEISCQDMDVVTTMLYRSQRFETAGCIPGFLNGGVVSFNAAMYMVTATLHMGSRATPITISLSLLGQFALGMGVGLSRIHYVATMVLFVLVGSWGCYCSLLLRQREEWDFACAKAIVYVTNQYRTLLHSLIPTNVLEKVCKSDTISAAEVPSATIMFCELDMSEMDISSVDSFVSALSDLLGQLDQEVKKRGMFKYQHVATGAKHSFIVCCPRVSCPYDEREQSLDYPVEYIRELFLLAFDVIDIAQRAVGWPYRDEHPIKHGVKVRVGLFHGPIATIVLGICRRFHHTYSHMIRTSPPHTCVTLHPLSRCPTNQPTTILLGRMCSITEPFRARI